MIFSVRLVERECHIHLTSSKSPIIGTHNHSTYTSNLLVSSQTGAKITARSFDMFLCLSLSPLVSNFSCRSLGPSKQQNVKLWAASLKKTKLCSIITQLKVDSLLDHLVSVWFLLSVVV